MRGGDKNSRDRSNKWQTPTSMSASMMESSSAVARSSASGKSSRASSRDPSPLMVRKAKDQKRQAAHARVSSIIKRLIELNKVRGLVHAGIDCVKQFPRGATRVLAACVCARARPPGCVLVAVSHPPRPPTDVGYHCCRGEEKGRRQRLGIRWREWSRNLHVTDVDVNQPAVS